MKINAIIAYHVRQTTLGFLKSFCWQSEMCKVAISVQCTYFDEAPVLAAECNKHRRLLDNSKWSSIQAVSGSNVATVILCHPHFSPLDLPLRRYCGRRIRRKQTRHRTSVDTGDTV